MSRLKLFVFRLINMCILWIFLLFVSTYLPKQVATLAKYFPVLVGIAVITAFVVSVAQGVLKIKTAHGETMSLKKDIDRAKHALTEKGVFMEGLFVLSKEHHKNVNN
ncbi:MAG: uncharacterized protein A8A55_2604 [Amphiamblys sp. WSBS2006]|nr:MAG: uncharacterized protein A8A55_2604 [Amphiamblys sp. WSBS2006]